MPLTLIPNTHWDRTFILLSLLSAYTLATTLTTHFTLLPTLSLLASLDIEAIYRHHYTTPLAFLTVTLPEIVLTVTLAALTWETKGHFWWQWFCTACLVVHWGAVVVQTPLRMRVKERQDRVAVEGLRDRAWMGTVAIVGCCETVIWVAVSVI